MTKTPERSGADRAGTQTRGAGRQEDRIQQELREVTRDPSLEKSKHRRRNPRLDGHRLGEDKDSRVQAHRQR